MGQCWQRGWVGARGLITRTGSRYQGGVLSVSRGTWWVLREGQICGAGTGPIAEAACGPWGHIEGCPPREGWFGKSVGIWLGCVMSAKGPLILASKVGMQHRRSLSPSNVQAFYLQTVL